MRNNLKRYTRVLLSLVLAVVVFAASAAAFAPKASAATAGSYFVRITFNVEEAGNFEQMFCKNKAANWGTETNDAVGCTIKYKKNNGTGDEGYFSWDFGNSGGKYGSALTGSDYAWVGNLANESGEHTITATVPGFPIGFYASTDDDRIAAVGGNTKINYTKIEAGSSSSNMTTLWTGRNYHESQNKWKKTYLYQSSTFGNDTEPFVVIEKHWYGDKTSGDKTQCISTTSKTWTMPYASTVSAITGSSSVNVPKTGTTTANYTAGTVKDQYGVNWYQDASLSMTAKNGCTFSNGTLSVPSSANRASNYTVSIKETCGSATATKNVTIKVFNYNITFKNENGDILQETACAYDAIPQYTGATPAKEADVQYSYTFDGWDRELAAARADAEYTAKYTSSLNKYTVKFLNEDGTELQSGLWEYGSTPVYSGSTPQKASDVEFNYTFADWDREIDEVTGDATYTATYTSSTRGYTVEWRDWDNSLIEKDENVLYNTVPTFDGSTPEREADAHYSYTFKGWTPAVSNITGDTVYTAAYNLVPQKYTITFKNEDGTVLEEKQVDYGTEPVYKGETPAKPYTNRNHYTFHNVWSPEITIVTGDAEYTAQFTESRHSYSYYFNGSYHWQKCSCGYTTAQTAHILDADGMCICGYDKNEMADYTEVEKLIDNAPKSIYFTEESYAALIAAEDAVDRTYDIGRQDEVDAMAESIRTAIDNLEPISHTVRVTNGSVNQSVIKSVSRYYYVATISAPKTNGSGQKFSYWEKTDGTKVATYRNYSFLVTEDITLRPVYGVSKDSADFPLYASRVIDIRDNGDKTHSILVEHSASTTVERITGHGVLITTDPSIGTNKDAMITTNEDVQDFAANKSARTLTGLFEIPVTFNTPGTVYARSYIIDSEGIVHLGEIYSFNVNSASTSAYDEELIAVDSVETVVEQNDADITDEPAQTGSVWSTVLNVIMTVIARIFNYIKASAAIIKF